MNILLIEDDQNKTKQLTEHIYACFTDIEIKVKMSYQSGLKSLIEDNYELILLDMSMPTYDVSPLEQGGRPRPFAGREILRQMQRRRIQAPVIIVTQFEKFGESDNAISLKELSSQLKKSYSENYKGTVYYNASLNNWKSELTSIIDKLLT